jgi:AcrR family transcriptional regulator
MPTADARTRILDAAYDLFSRRGIRAVGIDAIITQSGVARRSLYRHFASKEDLVLAFLERREEQWTRGWLMVEVERRATEPEDRLLAAFDVLDEWFRRGDYEGCPFIQVMLETCDRDDPVYRASTSCLAEIRLFVESLAGEAGIPEPEELARNWQTLMKGAIVDAYEGDRDAALRAKSVARLLLAQSRLTSASRESSIH